MANDLFNWNERKKVNIIRNEAKINEITLVKVNIIF